MERDPDVCCCHVSSLDQYSENDYIIYAKPLLELVICLGKASVFQLNIMREQSNTHYNPELKCEVCNSKGLGVLLTTSILLRFSDFCLHGSGLISDGDSP